MFFVFFGGFSEELEMVDLCYQLSILCLPSLVKISFLFEKDCVMRLFFVQVENPVGPSAGRPDLGGHDSHPDRLRLASSGLPARIQTQGDHQIYTVVHCKKKLAVFPSAAGMSLTKLSLAGNNFIIPEARESLVSDIPAWDRKTIYLFLQCSRIEILVRLMSSLRNWHLFPHFLSSNRATLNSPSLSLSSLCVEIAVCLCS